MPEFRKEQIRRARVLIAAAILVLTLFGLRLVYLQLVQGDSLLQQATSSTTYSFSVTAARGEIIDSQGRSLATNTIGYDVVMNNLMLGTANLNATLKELIEILQASGESWNDTMLVSQPDATGHYTFTDDSNDDTQQEQLAALKTAVALQQYATADDVMKALVEKYDLQRYDIGWQRILAGVRYQMALEEFSNITNFTLATDVSMKTVATIKERSLTLNGVQIVETSVRTYPDGTILPHVLGSVGKIAREQWYVENEDGTIAKPLADAGYKMNDLIGQSGLESSYESSLRGTNGTMEIVRDSAGVIQSSSMAIEPEPGKTLVLTLDSAFQKRIDAVLENYILTLQSTKGQGKGRETCAGAIVVLDVKTGGILASSTYPSYDLNQYQSNFSAYSSDPNLPLVNRALQGQYTPGSSFKPAVALAALLNGTITPSNTVFCGGTYYYYSGYHPTCLGTRHRGTNVNLYTAIKYSCNIFFYDVGRRVGIENYDAMAERLGLGVATGTEVNEALGHLTRKDDSNYSNGLEIQAAIGQGNTIVTPVQLATYAATIANGGIRYKTHFVAGLQDTNTGEMVETYGPVAEDTIEDNIGAFSAVQNGMVGVTSTMSAVANYPYTLASKTGSPQRAETYNGGTNYVNSVLIGYGPVESPEIAVGLVLEYGGGGANAGALLADVFNAYYFAQSDADGNA